MIVEYIFASGPLLNIKSFIVYAFTLYIIKHLYECYHLDLCKKKSSIITNNETELPVTQHYKYRVHAVVLTTAADITTHQARSCFIDGCTVVQGKSWDILYAKLDLSDRLSKIDIKNNNNLG